MSNDATTPDATNADGESRSGEKGTVDSVPGQHGDDDPTQNAPLPDGGPTNGSDGVDDDTPAVS